MLRVCRHYRWLHSYVLLVCRQHRRPAFVRVAETSRYARLSYICTCCASATITAGYIHTCSSSAVYIVDLHSYVLQKLVGTHRSPTFVHAARMQSTPLTCIRTSCRTSLVHTADLHSYTLHVCRHYRWIHSYKLLVCHQHRRPAFVHVTKPRCYPLLSYIGTRCSSDDYIIDLHSYALQNLVGMHRCPTFIHAARLPLLPLATFVRAPRLPSTSSTCVRMHCRTLLVHTAVVHSYTLHVCHHYRWVHSYTLLVCHQHRRHTFVCVAKHRYYPLLSYIRTCCSSAIYIVALHSYTLQKLVGTHFSPTFVRAARMQSTPLTCVRTCCGTSSVRTAVLHSYMLRLCRRYRWLHSYPLLVYCQHRRPAFVRVGEPHWYTPLSYIRTHCVSAAIAAGYICTCSTSAVNTAELHSYALQNLVSTHCCPTFVSAVCLPSLPLATFVRATRLPSTSSTCVRKHFKTLLLPTAVLHSYMLLVCRRHRLPAFVRVAEARWYALLSYICTYCSYAVNTANLRSYVLQNFLGTHRCPTFVHVARLPPLPLATFVHAAHLQLTSSTCVHTRCRTSLLPTAVLHSYMLLVCPRHRLTAFVRLAEPCWYALLSYIRICYVSGVITAGYIRTCYSSATNIVDLRSYAFQNLVATNCCPTFVRAASLPSTSSTCVCTHCKTSLVRTALLHSYALLVCSQHC